MKLKVKFYKNSGVSIKQNQRRNNKNLTTNSHENNRLQLTLKEEIKTQKIISRKKMSVLNGNMTAFEESKKGISRNESQPPAKHRSEVKPKILSVMWIKENQKKKPKKNNEENLNKNLRKNLQEKLKDIEKDIELKYKDNESDFLNYNLGKETNDDDTCSVNLDEINKKLEKVFEENGIKRRPSNLKEIEFDLSKLSPRIFSPNEETFSIYNLNTSEVRIIF